MRDWSLVIDDFSEEDLNRQVVVHYNSIYTKPGAQASCVLHQNIADVEKAANHVDSWKPVRLQCPIVGHQDCRRQQTCGARHQAAPIQPAAGWKWLPVVIPGWGGNVISR
jgi:hypothetical protein